MQPRRSTRLTSAVLMAIFIDAAGKSQNLFREDLSPDAGSKVSVKTAVDYVKKHKPLPDDFSDDQLEMNAKYALRTRALPYASEVSDDLFLTNVLPYRHFDEPVDDWRQMFYETLVPFVKDSGSLQEAADALFPAWSNAFGAQLQFEGNNTPQVLAPVSQTLRLGHASCTGMSIFLANCFRSVGIPARIVGVAEWKRPEGGNHNWVEVWTGAAWSFVDAVPDGELAKWNETWFNEQASKQEHYPLRHAILSPLWGSQADTVYNISWRDPPRFIPAIDVTNNYVGFAETPLKPETNSGTASPFMPWWSVIARILSMPLFVSLSMLIAMLLAGVGLVLSKSLYPRAGYVRLPD